jgi:hypothetical protein
MQGKNYEEKIPTQYLRVRRENLPGLLAPTTQRYRVRNIASCPAIAGKELFEEYSTAFNSDNP